MQPVGARALRHVIRCRTNRAQSLLCFAGGEDTRVAYMAEATGSITADTMEGADRAAVPVEKRLATVAAAIDALKERVDYELADIVTAQKKQRAQLATLDGRYDDIMDHVERHVTQSLDDHRCTDIEEHADQIEDRLIALEEQCAREHVWVRTRIRQLEERVALLETALWGDTRTPPSPRAARASARVKKRARHD